MGAVSVKIALSSDKKVLRVMQALSWYDQQYQNFLTLQLRQFCHLLAENSY